MSLVQIRSKRKKTGGLYHRSRKKKKGDFGSDFIPTKIGKLKVKTVRKLAGGSKKKLMEVLNANVTDSETGKITVSKILNVKENAANPHFVRMNVITKGAIIETEAGRAKVTSRPGQHGVINAVLVKN